MIFKAIEFAVKAHSGQFRKQSRLPYIVHPIAVAKLLITHNCHDTTVVAGILHDTVEDTPVTLKELQEQFGSAVAELVAYATEPDKSYPWEMRKQHTLETIRSAPEEACLLICADKLHNLRSIREEMMQSGEAVWHRFSRPKEKQRWYFESLVQAFNDNIDGEVTHNLFKKFEEEVRNVFGDHK